MTRRDRPNGSLGAALDAATRAKKWSWKRLANELGTTQRTVMRWASNEGVPNEEFEKPLKQKLGIDPVLVQKARAAKQPPLPEDLAAEILRRLEALEEADRMRAELLVQLLAERRSAQDP